ncbi:MAG: M28 family peptidase [Thermoanaerobaculia bacterium]
MGRHDRVGLVALGILGLMLAVVPTLYEPPEPATRNAPADEFSAARAREVLRELIGDGEPRPAGSAANARARRALIERFESLGYATELQESFACGSWGQCAPVANLLAWRRGDEDGRAVLLMAHYDSVTAGPGAADNASGTAILLESARALAGGPPARNPILFLVTDGEELGLLGAEVFLSDHPRAARVGAVVNVEARGSGGASVMFETGPGNAGSVRLFAAAARRPVTSSLFDAIYQRLPNDTDFTPFKARGLPGLNFAFVGHPLRYHTRQDRFEHLDAGSLQQQGANALAAARALAAADLAALPRGDAVFFDLLGRVVVWWPAAWSWGIVALAWLLLIAAVWSFRRAGALRTAPILWGFAGTIAAPVAGWACASGLAFLSRRSGASPGTWVAEPLPLILAFWLLAVAAAAVPAILVARRMDRPGLWAGIWLAWALLGLLLTAIAPGAAYLFSLPALAAGLAALPGLRSGRLPRGVGSVLPALAAAPLWFPLLWFLYDGMGLTIMPSVTVLAALLVWGLAPAFPGRETRWVWGLPLAAGVAVLVCLGWAMTRPPYTPDQPRPLNLLFVQDAEAGEAFWAGGASEGALPEALTQAAGFSREITQPLPWAPRFDAFTANASSLPVAPPELAVLSDRIDGEKRRLRLRLHSPRGARSVGLALPAEVPVESVRVAGRRVPERRAKTALGEGHEWRRFETWTVGAKGVDIELVIGSRDPLPVILYDESADLPAAGRPLLAARPRTASPFGRGDRTILFRRMEL